MAQPQPKRDTAGAQLAMAVAWEHLTSAQQHINEAISDPAVGASLFPTLSLAANKVKEAKLKDPDALLNQLSLKEIEAQCLYMEAQCRSTSEPKRALAILDQAIKLTPNDHHFYYLAGLIHLENYNKPEAVEFIQKAITLNPDEIKMHAMLDTAKNLSNWSVSAHHGARVADGSYPFLGGLLKGVVLGITLPFRILGFILRLK